VRQKECVQHGGSWANGQLQKTVVDQLRCFMGEWTTAKNCVTHSATQSAIRSATHSATHSSTRSAIHSATHFATHSATHSAAHSASSSETHSATHTAANTAVHHKQTEFYQLFVNTLQYAATRCNMLQHTLQHTPWCIMGEQSSISKVFNRINRAPSIDVTHDITSSEATALAWGKEHKGAVICLPRMLHQGLCGSH